ncbi:hypothetical protein DTO164E3_4346 [Paecilomyces variotii]|nr:hypothetical protein DTO164E3_4346 [Paecilomyces variotii]KAJ9284095.1 hypothetical protein DTO021C3_8349 [Paecilomyces variotii]
MELMPQAAEMEGEGDGEKQREKAISPSSSRPGQVSLRRILHRNIISHPPHPGEPSLLLLSSTFALIRQSGSVAALLRLWKLQPSPAGRVRNVLVRQLLAGCAHQQEARPLGEHLSCNQNPPLPVSRYYFLISRTSAALVRYLCLHPRQLYGAQVLSPVIETPTVLRVLSTRDLVSAASLRPAHASILNPQLAGRPVGR